MAGSGCRRTEPEIAVEVLSEGEHVAGLLGGPRGERVLDARGSLRAGGGKRRQGAGRERQQHRTYPSADDGGHTSGRCCHTSGVAVYLADAGQGVP